MENIKKIYCEVCENSKRMEVSETIDGTIFCSCTKCGMPYQINEVQNATIENKNYVFLPLLNAFFSRDTITKKYFHKLSFNREGKLKKRVETIGYKDSDYEYIDSKVL